MIVEAEDLVPSDGTVIEGVAYVNAGRHHGESAPVLKEPGSDVASSVRSGTQVISDWIKVEITSNAGETFLGRMIALVEGAKRQRTPNEIALSILLARPDHQWHAGRRDAPTVRDLAGGHDLGGDPGGPAGLPDPDHDRRPALGDRHQPAWTGDPLQRPGDERAGRRGGRRRRHPAPGQDRHDHVRQPDGV